MSASRLWTPDEALGPAFECSTLPLAAEQDGPLVATLVRRRRDTATATRRAVLYVHGFIDYFFQAHVADAFAAAGWDFYALDLRRYGRSMRPGNLPNYCTDLAQYDEELSAALDIVRHEDAHDTVALLGHSTGGLITSWYMHRGARRSEVQALVLNSPFLAFNVPWPRSMTLPIASAIGAFKPTLADPNGISRWYGESLLAEHRGEWHYDLRWKPLLGFPIYFGWVRAIRAVQAEVARGLHIAAPVLLLHAAQSMIARGGWQDAYRSSDIVLNVDHMRTRGPRLGTDVSLHSFVNGIHDMLLAPERVREAVLLATLSWLEARTGDASTDETLAAPYVAVSYQPPNP